MPTISVLIIAGTGRPYLVTALRSLVAQDLQDWEAIVVEACAVPEDTSKVLDQVAEVADARVRVVSYDGDRSFPPYASKKWNFALQHATGQIIAWCDDDDAKEPNWLSVMCGPLLAKPNLATTFCNGQLMDANGARTSALFGSPSLDYEYLLHANFITTGQLAVRKSVVDEIGGFDEILGCAEDYDFAIRLANRPWQFVGETKCLKRDSVSNACYHVEVVTQTQVALRRLLTKHGVIDSRCSNCRGPLEPDPGTVVGGWHWRIRHSSVKWNILCGKDEGCA